MRVCLGRVLLIGVVLCVARPAEAKKFNFKDVGFATYFKGTYGTTKVGGGAFENSIPESVSVGPKPRVNYSGEFGILFTTEWFNLRLGAELLLPEHISDVKGRDASNTDLFTLDTQTSAVIPMAYIDANLLGGSFWKFYAGVGTGVAYVIMENKYEMTETGVSTLGMGDFVEKATGTAAAFVGHAGLEVLFTDNVTLVLDAGYRYVIVEQLKHDRDATTFQGTVQAGDIVKDRDGSERNMDLGGPYAGLAFRFYLDI